MASDHVPYIEPTKIWNKSFVSIFIANMALTMGQYMSNSILALYAGSLGAATSVVGVLMSLFAVSSIFFRFISGPIMDTYDRKYVVMVATATLVIVYLGFSVSNDVSLLFVFRLIQGGGMAFGNACCLAMISQILPSDKYGAGIGYYSMAQMISQSLGNPIGLWLAGFLGYKLTFAFAAVVMAIAVILASQVKLPYARTKKLQINFRNVIAKEAILPASIMFCVMIGFVIVNSFLALYAEEKGIVGNVGLYFTFAAATMIITRPMVGRLTDKFGVVRILIPSLFANVICFFLISFAQSIWPILLAGFVSAFGFGACQPAVQALSMKSVSNERRGAASSTNYIGMDLGHLVGPSIAGIVAELAGYESMWRIMTLPFFAGMLIVFTFRKQISFVEDNFRKL